MPRRAQAARDAALPPRGGGEGERRGGGDRARAVVVVVAPPQSPSPPTCCRSSATRCRVEWRDAPPPLLADGGDPAAGGLYARAVVLRCASRAPTCCGSPRAPAPRGRRGCARTPRAAARSSASAAAFRCWARSCATARASRAARRRRDPRARPLPVATTIARASACGRARPRRSRSAPGAAVEGFELHCGRTAAVEGAAGGRPRCSGSSTRRRPPRPATTEPALDGAVVGRVVGTYLHGIFESCRARRALLRLGDDDGDNDDGGGDGDGGGACAAKEDPFERLAAHLVGCGLDFETVMGFLPPREEQQHDTDGAAADEAALGL